MKIMEEITKISEKRVVPIGVKIIAVLYYIYATLLISPFIFAFAAEFFHIGCWEGRNLTPFIDVIFCWALPIFFTNYIVFAILIFGVFTFFIGRGLWKGRNWARIGVLIWVILYFFGSYYFTGYIPISSLIINLAIAGYLLFSKGVRRAFV